jgi:hypothetical protein
VRRLKTGRVEELKGRRAIALKSEKVEERSKEVGLIYLVFNKSMLVFPVRPCSETRL